MRFLRSILDILLGRYVPLPPPVPPPVPPTVPGDVKAALLAAVNAVRPGRPLSPLPALYGTAQAWADRLAAAGGGISHGDFYARVSAAYKGPISEDIAGGQTTPAGVVADWMADPPHRASITDPTYRYAGVGVATHPGGWTYWVLDLGG